MARPAGLTRAGTCRRGAGGPERGRPHRESSWLRQARRGLRRPRRQGLGRQLAEPSPSLAGHWRAGGLGVHDYRGFKDRVLITDLHRERLEVRQIAVELDGRPPTGGAVGCVGPKTRPAGTLAAAQFRVRRGCHGLDRDGSSPTPGSTRRCASCRPSGEAPEQVAHELTAASPTRCSGGLCRRYFLRAVDDPDTASTPDAGEPSARIRAGGSLPGRGRRRKRPTSSPRPGRVGSRAPGLDSAAGRASDRRVCTSYTENVTKVRCVLYSSYTKDIPSI
jgi:hypothetical protein